MMMHDVEMITPSSGLSESRNRMRVPGGWWYEHRISNDLITSVFVPDPPTNPKLDAELQRRFWALYDAATNLNDSSTPHQWAEFFIAVGKIPESQRPHD